MKKWTSVLAGICAVGIGWLAPVANGALLGYWPLNDGHGQFAKDIAQTNTALLGASDQEEPQDPRWLEKSEGSGLLFDGLESCLQISSDASFDFSDKPGFSLQVSFLLLEVPERQRRINLFTKGYDSGWGSWGLILQSGANPLESQTLGFSFKDKTGALHRVSSGSMSFPLNQWIDVIVTGDRQHLRLYVNGHQLGEAVCPALPENTTTKLLVGKYVDPPFAFSGAMRDIRLYDEAIVPEPPDTVNRDPAHVLLHSRFSDPGALAIWTPLSGNWELADGTYREFSDLEYPDSRGAWTVAGDAAWSDYSLHALIGAKDSLGSILLQFYRRDAENYYLLRHEQLPGDVIQVKLLSCVAGRLEVMASVDNGTAPWLSDVADIRASSPLARFTIHVRRGTICVLINGKRVLSLKDTTHLSGGIALGGEQRKVFFTDVSVDKEPVSLLAVTDQKPPLRLEVNQAELRHAFVRGERAELNVRIVNQTDRLFGASHVECSVDGGISDRVIFDWPELAASQTTNRTILFDTTHWKRGDYRVTVRAVSANQTVETDYELFVAQPKDDRSFVIGPWGGTSSAAVLREYAQHGLNTLAVTVRPGDDYEYVRPLLARLHDEALRQGTRLAVKYQPLWEPPPGSGTETFVIRHDGSKGDRPNPMHPDHQAWSLASMEVLARFLAPYPAVYMLELNSEVENILEPSYSPLDRERARKALGFEPPVPEGASADIDGVAGRVTSVPPEVKARTPTVFSDDEPWYRFFKWLWQEGFGDNVMNAQFSEIMKRHRPDVLSLHDPFRDVPLYQRNRGLDVVATWYYNTPDSRETLLAVDTLLEAARPEKQQISLDPSLWMYSGTLANAKTASERCAGVMPADFIMGAMWIGLSRKPQSITFYDLEEITPRSVRGFQQPQLYKQLADFSQNVAQPLWPMLSGLDQTKNPCAFLLSFGSQLFGEQTWGGYGYASGNGYYAVLNMAHLPSDILFEEGILNGRLEAYRFLFMHKITHLPQAVFDKIVAFAKSGGTVVCGKPFADLIPGAVDLDLDMSRRTRSRLYYYQKKDGFSAVEMEESMRQQAREMRARFLDAVHPYADTPSECVLLKTLEQGEARYLFVINDLRVAGDYVGQFGSALEKGVPQRTRISIRETDCAVYDVLAHTRVAVEEGGDSSSWDAELPAAGGRIYAIYPKPIAAVRIEAPKTLTLGQATEIRIHVEDAGGVPIAGAQPLDVRLFDAEGKEHAFSRYCATVGGEARLALTPATNDAQGEWRLVVRDLASGLTDTRTFEVQ